MRESFDHEPNFRSTEEKRASPLASGMFYAAFVICVLISVGLKLFGLSK